MREGVVSQAEGQAGAQKLPHTPKTRRHTCHPDGQRRQGQGTKAEPNSDRKDLPELGLLRRCEILDWVVVYRSEIVYCGHLQSQTISSTEEKKKSERREVSAIGGEIMTSRGERERERERERESGERKRETAAFAVSRF